MTIPERPISRCMSSDRPNSWFDQHLSISLMLPSLNANNFSIAECLSSIPISSDGKGWTVELELCNVIWCSSYVLFWGLAAKSCGPRCYYGLTSPPLSRLRWKEAVETFSITSRLTYQRKKIPRPRVAFVDNSTAIRRCCCIALAHVAAT